MRRRPLWHWWIPLVIVISLPWLAFTAEPQWDRIHWIPFTRGDKSKDVVANILLFVPFGISFTWKRPDRRYARAVAAAMALSLCAEASQLLGLSRYPSATDVLAAVLGTLIGAGWMQWVEHER